MAESPKAFARRPSGDRKKRFWRAPLPVKRGCQFFSISGSDFVEMFAGSGASRVRDLFVQQKMPRALFHRRDRAVGRHRGAGLGGGHDEREQTLNQLLVEMDGFEANEGVILIAATNRPDVLDPALLRPGRLTGAWVVPRPDVKAAKEFSRFIRVKCRWRPMSTSACSRARHPVLPGGSGKSGQRSGSVGARNNKEKVKWILRAR